MNTHISLQSNELTLVHQELIADSQLLRKHIHQSGPTINLHVGKIDQKIYCESGFFLSPGSILLQQQLTRIFGISRRPLTSREPGGKGRPPDRVHLTRARIGPSSRHWNTTSKPFQTNKYLALIAEIFFMAEHHEIVTQLCGQWFSFNFNSFRTKSGRIERSKRKL